MEENLELNRTIEESVTIIDPCVAHLIKMINSVETNRELIADTGIREKVIACIPINNGNEQENKKGSHWSLLVWKKERNRGKFMHYDPIEDMNSETAIEVIKKLNKVDERNYIENKKEAKCPRQSNSYDCGIYVVLMIEKIIRNIKEGK